MNDLKLGEIIEIERQRDAIHMAVAPIIAGMTLLPGSHVRLENGKAHQSNADAIGVVDPFLKRSVKEGERFWLFLYPGTITGLRHEWSHPAFSAALRVESTDPKDVSKRWLEDIAQRCGVSYDRMMNAVEERDYINMGENESYKRVLDGVFNDFTKHCEVVLGHPTDTYPFSCSC